MAQLTDQEMVDLTRMLRLGRNVIGRKCIGGGCEAFVVRWTKEAAALNGS